ncbi:hypothetical protein [Deinococcus cellulosilyticus]|uniref:MYM-type domain-containing protein n=1 Tax=Deinococcus cellulosilyticus (strain DSM 18568 / NBRC 106333 / KACC 11606 / 5516J-15) TaxID=1223518 RepID=A0A511N9Z9_DEIC1|nr:hypothetical protein [Deinococcus cellulosilyticus]GEM49654.1 hypothetical protein DC3_52890 [Deinococcus cellulosilyticus NBRC 106333 = KACC 11606]
MPNKVVKLERWEICRNVEETSCQYCGVPLYTGDAVYQDQSSGADYCSTHCAKASTRADTLKVI